MPEEVMRSARILIVDDNEAHVYLLDRLLRQAGFTRIDGVTDSRQAVTRYTELQPDLVLLALRMSHLDGFQVLAELGRCIPASGYMPILVLTADPSGAALRRALTAGARDFVTRPFDKQEVLLRIRNLLETRFLHLALEGQKEGLEDQKQALEAQVRERTRQLVQMEKLSTMGQLLAGVAHELNNPLAIVCGHAQLLQLTGAGTPHAARAEKIARAADRCVRIVRNFLALARDSPPERTGVDLNVVVREAVDLLGYELQSAGIELRLDLTPGLPVLWADSHQLHQVIVNLMTNAHHAMRNWEGHRVLTLSTSVAPDADGGRVSLTVRDTGPGIPAEVQARLFEPFFTTKPPDQGTGLGLSMSQGVVQGHGGTLRATSEPGAGAVFTVELPVVERPAEAPAADGETNGLAVRPLRILVIDDEPELAAVLVDMLEGDGHEVHTAANGAEALTRLEQQQYDAVLSDTRMPVLDGPGFYLEVVRRYPALTKRVGFLTGDVLSRDKRAFLQSTGAPTVAKPFALDSVRAIVRRLQPEPVPSTT